MNEVSDLTLLAIDAGNTRVKWGLFDATGNLLESKAYLHQALENVHFPTASRTILSNVAGKTLADQLQAKLTQHTDIEWLIAQQNACGVFNGYDTPSQLGTDRWAALIGAWHLKKSTCIVVNAGTAITIDALIAKNNRAEFIGGLILPGFNLMQNNLHLGTAKLPKMSEKLSVENLVSDDLIGNLNLLLGKNTEEAMQYGSLAAILGAIKQVHLTVIKQTQQSPIIILSGGDAGIILQTLAKEITPYTVNYSIDTIEHVVLHGLYRLSNMIQSGAQ